MFTTSAPWSAAHRTPLAMSSKEPLPSSSTFTGMIYASGATPAMPMPLLVAAAAMPATWVPWLSEGWATPSGPFQSPLPQDGLHVDERGSGHQLALQVGMAEVDAGVDDGDDRPGPGAGGPRLLGVDLLRAVLLGVQRVVGRGGEGRRRRQRDR